MMDTDQFYLDTSYDSVIWPSYTLEANYEYISKESREKHYRLRSVLEDSQVTLGIF